MIAINLRITTMQGGEDLVLEGTCALAVTIADVPEVSPSAIERHWLCETRKVTVCAPTHPLAASAEPVSMEDFGRHVQLVVTDNQPGAEKTQMGVAGKRQWLLNDLSAKHDFLKAGLCWGHMPAHLVAEDLASGKLIELKRRAWHIRPLNFHDLATPRTPAFRMPDAAYRATRKRRRPAASLADTPEALLVENDQRLANDVHHCLR